MIYDQPEAAEALSQEDILDDCPILFWEIPGPENQPESATMPVRVVVLTQACDLAQVKATRVLVAVIYRVQHLIDRGILQSKIIRGQIRTHRVYGWYFLPTGGAVEESVVDLRDLHTLPRAMLERLIHEGK